MTETNTRQPRQQVKSGAIEADEMLLIKDAAALLNCSVPQVYRLANSGQIPSLRVGAMVRIPKNSFLRWIAKHTSGDGQD
jgi:excisionase family DNA binding protein